MSLADAPMTPDLQTPFAEQCINLKQNNDLERPTPNNPGFYSRFRTCNE